MHHEVKQLSENALNYIPDIKGDVLWHSIGGHWVGADKEYGSSFKIVCIVCTQPTFKVFTKTIF